MVWGMNLPPGSNGFYVEGEFEGTCGIASNGWRARLADHYSNEMSQVQKLRYDDNAANGAHNYAGRVTGKFSAIDRLQRPGSAREPIEAHEVPRFYQVTRGCKEISALSSISGPTLIVNEGLMQFIEWLEPDVHGFFPIEMRRPSGTIIEQTRYILVINQFIDSFCPGASDPEAFVDHVPGFFLHSERPKHVRGLAFQRSAVGDAHLWREKRMADFLLCFSDRLQAEITDAGLRIPRHYRMREV